jgi:2-polyprenyl-3-methyl-5-hydroxy-6-metoxy-1,4-benzoquinol methylase
MPNHRLGGLAGLATAPDGTARRAQVVAALADAIRPADPPARVRVAVDAVTGEVAPGLADELARALAASGRPAGRATLDGSGRYLDEPLPAPAAPAGEPRTVLVVDGRFLQHPELAGAWDLVVYLREDAAAEAARSVPARLADRRVRAVARYLAEVDPEASAGVVVDCHDPGWPIIRRVDPAVAARIGRDLHPAETRAFFAPRAAGWELRFPEDDPAYAAVVVDLGLLPGQTVVDLGCGTGRALPHLRAAVGPGGTVLGLDLTPEMLDTASQHGRAADATLVLADARRLPLRDACVDAVFAAGLLPHLPDADAGLAGIARVTRPGGRLCLFHPSGRAALAARHGRRVCDDDLLGEPVLRAVLARTGWRLEHYEDAPNRFLALVVLGR